MHGSRLLGRAIIAVAVIVFCVGTAVGQTGPVRCAGCKTEHFLIEHLKPAYGAATGVKLMPAGTGNKKAVQLLAEGELAFAYTCKAHGKLAKKFKLDPAVTADWQSVAIARDPIVVLTSPDCGVSALTLDQLKAVFAGQVANWSEVGGADLPVTVAFLDDTVESGTVTVFKEVTVGAKNSLAAGAKRLPAPSALGNFAKKESGVITFMALNSYKPGYGQVVAVDGIGPEKDAIISGTYPLAVTYHLVHAGGEEALGFLAFMQSPAGAALIDEVMVALPGTGTPVP